MRFLTALQLLIPCLAFPIAVLAQPSAGFVEDFATTLGEFGGGDSYSNPGTGGVGGATDGFLLVERAKPFHFGTRSFAAAFTGDYLAAGITKIRFALNDVGADQVFAIHFGIGAGGGNFWLYTTAFTPPENAWAEFEVDLTNEALFTRIRGSGTFAEALSGATNILIRHDLPPLTDSPDDIAGELGIDHIQLIGPAPVEPRTWGEIKHLFP
jgi:hypothetical protein